MKATLVRGFGSVDGLRLTAEGREDEAMLAVLEHTVTVVTVAVTDGRVIGLTLAGAIVPTALREAREATDGQTDPEDDPCDFCGKPVGAGAIVNDDEGRVFCDRACLEENETAEAERAYERSVERYYGGDGPVTLDEQHAAAWAEKRKLKGW